MKPLPQKTRTVWVWADSHFGHTADGADWAARSARELFRNVGRPDYALVHAELRKKSVTLQLLWQEYKQAHPDGYQYSAFCFHYKEFKKTIEYAFRNTYKAGEKIFEKVMR